MRVRELVAPDVAEQAGYKTVQEAPIATVNELADYDAIEVELARHQGRHVARIAAKLAA